MPNKRKNSKIPPESPSLLLSPPSSPDPLPMEETLEPPKVPPTARKPPLKSKKKPPISKKMLAITQKKLALLSQNLRPLPFYPNPKTLESVAAHEPLFRSLNLWDFATLRLDDTDLRPDLLADLIAYYDSIKHHSLVRGLRVYLSRAELGRALSLPSAKPNHRSSSSKPHEFDASQFGGADEVAAVLSGFISNMMVFLDDDAAILPAEVVTANRLVREGQPNRVDWAGLMWALVEKEILGVPENGSCYYASHLQRLMKHQKPKLFEDVADDGEAELDPSEVATVEEDVDGEELGDVVSEKCEPPLSLGIGGDAEENKTGEETEQPLFDGKDTGMEHCLPESGLDGTAGAVTTQCGDLSKDERGKRENLEDGEGCLPEFSLNYFTGTLQCEDLSKEEPDKGQHEDLVKEEPDKGGRVEGDKLRGEENKGKSVDNVLDDELAAAKFPSLERLTSSDFMQVMGNSNNLSFGLDQSNGEFLAMGSDMHNKSMDLDMGPGGSFLFGNEHKRPVDEIDDHANGFNQDHQQKRFRSDQPWEHTPTVSAFDGCIEQLQNLMGKARMDIVEKEQAHVNVQVQVQYVNGMLQQKDEIIQALEKNAMLEMQKREIESRRFEHDIKTLSGIVFGCKKALKDTQLAFAEYRKRFPMGNEPLNGEGGGTASDVLGAKELIKPCLTKEEEIARRLINDFYKSCSEKFNNYATSISMYATKLVQLREEIELITKRLAKDKVQKTMVE